MVGDSKRLARFKADHPVCCYCGGTQATQTIDHAPPKSLFLNKQRPKGLEVPSCKRCNNAHAPFDDFFSVLGQVQISGTKDRDHLVEKKRLSGIQRRFPEAYAELAFGGQRVLLKKNGLLSKVVLTKISSAEAKFTLAYFTCRIVSALWYLERGMPLEVGTLMSAYWSSNLDLEQRSRSKEIIDLTTKTARLEQGTWTSAGQFEYRWNTDEDLGVYVLNIHGVFMTYGFLYGLQKLDTMELSEYYFEVSNEGLRPVNKPWPPNVRMGKEAA